MHDKPLEHECIRCSGAGLIKPAPDQMDAFVVIVYGVRVCPSCNGKGRVIFDDRKVIKYDMDAQVKRVIFGVDNAA